MLVGKTRGDEIAPVLSAAVSAVEERYPALILEAIGGERPPPAVSAYSDPKGEEDRAMCVEWKDVPGFDREALIARLNGARRVADDGRVFYEVDPEKGGDPLFDDAAGLLEAAFDFPEGQRSGSRGC